MSERLTRFKEPETATLSDVHGTQIPEEYAQIYQEHCNRTNSYLGDHEGMPPDREFSEENANFTTSGTIFQMKEVVSKTTPVKHWSKRTKSGFHRGPGSYEINKSKVRTNRDNRIRRGMNK